MAEGPFYKTPKRTDDTLSDKMSILDKPVLVLNRSWQAVNTVTVQAALSTMAANAATGMNLAENGE